MGGWRQLGLPLGTDASGGATLSRLIFGARISLHRPDRDDGLSDRGIISPALAQGGFVDIVLMRTMDLIMSIRILCLP